jgi:hypothetical protein
MTTTFSGATPPVDQLPAAFKTAILNSQTGKVSAADDAVVGSLLRGSGYCASDEFKDQLYCACVNVPFANPECIFAPCANYGLAYKNSTMQGVVADRETNCPSTVNCYQILNMGGSKNIATGVSQTMNCGGVVETFITNIQAHPFLAIVVLVLILSVVMLVSGEGRARKGGPAKALLPPQLVLPSTL